jgi:hypothetical protein
MLPAVQLYQKACVCHYNTRTGHNRILLKLTYRHKKNRITRRTYTPFD